MFWMAGWAATGQERGAPWTRHAIDDAFKGADGVRFADANGDGLADIATAWEEGGVVRVYLNPGKEKVRERWPGVSVAKEASGEDAVLADVDGDGAMEVVSCHEGKRRAVLVHWPKDRGEFLDSRNWKTDEVKGLAPAQMWMFCLPTKEGLVLGSKGAKASVGLLSPPGEDRRDLSKWTWTAWYEAGWIMSMMNIDMNGDGALDVLVSDRYGAGAGVVWFENPGKKGGAKWETHRLAAGFGEPRFLDAGDFDGDGKLDVFVATPEAIVRLGADGRVVEKIALPEWAGKGKAVSMGDIDGDGVKDLVFSCESAGKGKSGVVWMKRDGGKWIARDISGPEGIKYDLVPLVDLDGDGDLDVVTTEEREGGKGLGVVWYENPRN